MAFILHFRLPSLLATARASLTAALALLAVDTASADPLSDRVEELLVWVGQKTGYEIQDVNVTVVLSEPRIINSVAYGPFYTGQVDIVAITVGTAIVLPDWFELGRDDDVLVHELTHVLQHASAARFRCVEEEEREAYEIASAFTELTGIGTKPSPWFIALLRCNPNPEEESK